MTAVLLVNRGRNGGPRNVILKAIVWPVFLVFDLFKHLAA
jgi:hypothetical protein